MMIINFYKNNNKEYTHANQNHDHVYKYIIHYTALYSMCI